MAVAEVALAEAEISPPVCVIVELCLLHCRNRV